MVNVQINNVNLRFRIDTGADITVINKKSQEMIQLPISKYHNKKLVDAGGKELKDAGVIETFITYKGQERKANLCVIEKAPQNLLGIPEIKALGLVYRVRGVKIEDKFQGLYKELGRLPEVFRIRLKSDAVPHSIPVPRKLPLGLREATERELKRMESMGVIERVEEYREWCAGMVVAPKSSGGVRICVDLTALNRSVKRENYPLPRVEETLALLEGSRVYSKMDANSGFWQIKLEEESRALTTFITPFGRFQFRVMPFGITSAPEFFQRQMNRILAGLPGVVCMMDDILVFGKSEAEHDERLEEVMKKISEAGMTLNKKKCEFRKSEVIFLGHKVTAEGIEADPEKVAAIRQMSPPTNKTELKSFLGMVNYLSKFSARLAETERPLRELGRKSSCWVWGPDQQRSFEEVKKEICNAPVLAKYELSKEHRVTADASNYALGAALLQRTEDGQWQPVAFVSRKLTEAEQKYAQIEKESLAITWACEKFDYFLVGTQFQVETDHKPLVKLLGRSDLANLPLRCQRFKLRLMRYDFKIFYTPGPQMFLADLLSRPAGEATSQERERAQRVELHVRMTIETEEMHDDIMLEEIRRQGSGDEIYQRVLSEIRSDWPRRGKDYKGELQGYWAQKEHLSESQGLLMRDDKIVIPQVIRRDFLERIHRGHQGVERCVKRARDSVWWPGMRKAIEDFVRDCNSCIKERGTEHYPMIPAELPGGPWAVVGTDLFQFRERDYLLIVDYYTRWIEVMEIEDKSAEAVVKRMKNVFARLGAPQLMRSDNGPCYESAVFKKFVEEWKIHTRTSSPRYPESNGLAERAVQTIKKMWSRERDKNLALLIYRSTPLASGLSPAELLYGRNIRTNIPLGHRGTSVREFEENDKRLKVSQKQQTDRRRRAKEREVLVEGDVVWVRSPEDKKGRRGVIAAERSEPHSYDVRIEGKLLRRNRKHLRKLNIERNIDGTSTEEEDSEDRGVYSESETPEEEVREAIEESTLDVNVPERRASKRVPSQKHLSEEYEWGSQGV